MKKIFTILFSFGLVTAAFAQSHGRNSHSQSGYPDARPVPGKTIDRDVYANDNRRYDDYNLRELNIQKQRINREYDARIMAVKRSRWLRASEKSRQVRLLERERMEEIRRVTARYSKSNNRYDDRYSKADNRKW